MKWSIINTIMNIMLNINNYIKGDVYVQNN